MQYTIERKERYNHRTTPEVLWRMVDTLTGNTIAECTTRKAAQKWLDIYTMPKAELIRKYPELSA